MIDDLPEDIFSIYSFCEPKMHRTLAGFTRSECTVSTEYSLRVKPVILLNRLISMGCQIFFSCSMSLFSIQF